MHRYREQLMVAKGEGEGAMGNINKTMMDINFLDHDIGILKGQLILWSTPFSSLKLLSRITFKMNNTD